MKTIIAGSRGIDDYLLLCDVIVWSCFPISEVVSGGARGVDKMGERYAKEHGLPCQVVRAKWKEQGKRAGIVRNLKMAEMADGLIALWDGESRGTKHMIDSMKKLGKKVWIWKTGG